MALSIKVLSITVVIAAVSAAITYLTPYAGSSAIVGLVVGVGGLVIHVLDNIIGQPAPALNQQQPAQSTGQVAASNTVTPANQNIVNGVPVAPLGSTFTTFINGAGNTEYLVTTPNGQTVPTIDKPIK